LIVESGMEATTGRRKITSAMVQFERMLRVGKGKESVGSVRRLFGGGTKRRRGRGPFEERRSAKKNELKVSESSHFWGRKKEAYATKNG